MLTAMALTAIVLSGCSNPVVQKQKNASQQSAARAALQKKYNQDSKENIQQNAKKVNKSQFSSMLNSNFQYLDFPAKYSQSTINQLSYEPVKTLIKNNDSSRTQTLLNKNNKIDNDNTFYYYNTKNNLSDNDKIALLDNLEKMYSAFTNKTNAGSKMDNYGSYINKADLIAKNPYKKYSNQKSDWNQLFNNLGVAQENLMYNDSDSNLSDNSNEPLGNRYCFYHLTIDYKKVPAVVDVLNVENQMSIVLQKEQNYIQDLSTNASKTQLDLLKQQIIQAQISLANNYESATQILKPAAKNIKQDRNESKQNQKKAAQWAKKAEKGEDKNGK